MATIPVTVQFIDGTIGVVNVEWPMAALWPGPTNTGVPAGSPALTVVNGDFNTTANGQVVDLKDIRGTLNIKHNNITVKRFKAYRVDAETQTHTGIILQDGEVYDPGNDGYTSGVAGLNMKMYRLNIHGVGQGLHVYSNWEIYDSWIHDLVGGNNPSWGPSHNEAIFGAGGLHGVVDHCKLEGYFAPGMDRGGGMSASLSLYGWQAVQEDILVQNSWIGALDAWFAAYGGGTHDHPLMKNVRFLNNVWGMQEINFNKNSSAITAFDKGVRGNIATGNKWTDGTPVAGLS